MKFLLLSVLLGLATQLPVYAQTDLSSYIGNDSLRIIPLKESVLYKDQWNRLALQSALYGQEYQPVIMQVSGAKYRMDDSVKNVLWMMPDSGSTKVTLRVGKNTKKGIAIKVKDFEFIVSQIRLFVKVIVNDTLIWSPQQHKVRDSYKKWTFLVEPDTAMFRQCPETAKDVYWIKDVDLNIGEGLHRQGTIDYQLTPEKKRVEMSFSKHNLIKGFPISFYVTVYKTSPTGLTSQVVGCGKRLQSSYDDE